MSRIGNKPIAVPASVKVTVAGAHVAMEGPQGKLAWSLPTLISASLENGQLRIARDGDSRRAKSLHGLSRSLIANMVDGVAQGYRKQLEIQGVGFRAATQGQTLTLHLGKSHPIVYPLPASIKVTVAENAQLTVEGPDKQMVGQVAAHIRRMAPAEPYKGKGIRYFGEIIRRKEGKTVQ